ncbi:MAG: DUF2065 family protein [Candidatus Omnitrophica bacterium]|nr:DUF2065 family protein [Candidatus Omnitrophota bacterium]
MEGIVKLFGIVMVVAGVTYFVKPALMKKVVDFFVKEKWLYVGSILCFIIGIIFLSAASQCAISWLVTIFGILALIKGILVFILGQQKIKVMLDSLTKKPTKALRAYALIEIVLGVILIYSV